MKTVKITSFEQINLLYAIGVNICKGCQYEHAASCVPERFGVCSKQCEKRNADIQKATHNITINPPRATAQNK